MVEDKHLTEKVSGVLVMTLLETLYVLVLITVHHFMMVIKKNLYQAKDQMKMLVQQRKTSINFSKANTKFCLSFHYNGDESDLYVDKRVIYKLKMKDNISWYNF